MFYPTPKETHMDTDERFAREQGKVGQHHVRIFGPNLSSAAQQKGDLHVHAEGCGDCKHYGPEAKFGGERTGWLFAADTVEDVTEAVYGPDEFDYDPATEIDTYTASFWFAPCTADLPNREAAPYEPEDTTDRLPLHYGDGPLPVEDMPLSEGEERLMAKQQTVAATLGKMSDQAIRFQLTRMIGGWEMGLILAEARKRGI
jgi:hypothetical protein